jgi:hypothetical protein
LAPGELVHVPVVVDPDGPVQLARLLARIACDVSSELFHEATQPLPGMFGFPPDPAAGGVPVNAVTKLRNRPTVTSKVSSTKSDTVTACGGCSDDWQFGSVAVEHPMAKVPPGMAML